MTGRHCPALLAACTAGPMYGRNDHARQVRPVIYLQILEAGEHLADTFRFVKLLLCPKYHYRVVDDFHHISLQERRSYNMVLLMCGLSLFGLFGFVCAASCSSLSTIAASVRHPGNYKFVVQIKAMD